MTQAVSRFLGLGLILVGAVALEGCASSGGGDGSSVYRRDLGRLLEPILEETRLKIWNRHGWQAVRRETEYQHLLWESDWRAFHPQTTGAATDPTDARGRIVIRGRRVQDEMGSNRVGGEGGLYRVTFHGEFEVRGGIEGDDWRPTGVPEAARTVFDEVYDDMYLELRTGIRRR